MPRKYELVSMGQLFRIKSIVGIPDLGVKPGDLGGIVAGPQNLSHDGNSWVTENAIVLNKAQVTEDSLVKDQAIIKDSVILGGESVICGNAVVADDALVNSEALLTGNVIVEGDAVIEGATTLYGVARIGDDARISSDDDWISISGIGRLNSTANIYRTVDEARITTGRWAGSSNELREVVADSLETWPSANQVQRRKWRKQYLYIADLADTIENGE